jgi:hypothetical protein
MTGDDAVVRVDKDRILEAEPLYAVGNLADLLL